MKSSDRKIFLGIAFLGLVAAFWFLVLAPKRAEISKLDEEITTLEASVAEQEQLAAAAEQAKQGYGDAYHRLVVLGKAVPGDADTPSLITQVSQLAADAGVDFRTIVLAEGAVAAPAPAPVPPPAEGAEPATDGEAAPAPTDPVAATEAAAATLPIGATVGAAGLPVMSYDLGFRGDFFEIADFMASLDALVRSDPSAGGAIGVDGRLLTVNGFSLEGDSAAGFPMLKAQMTVSSYVSPADQGVTGGATAGGPLPTSAFDTVAPTSTPAQVSP